MVPIFVPLFVTNAMTLSINPKEPNKFFTYSTIRFILSTMKNINVTWHGCQEELINEITIPKVSLPILFRFHFDNPNYINKCTRMMENQNKHENVIALWDEHTKKA
jgi:hypothetical protein